MINYLYFASGFTIGTLCGTIIGALVAAWCLFVV